MRSSASSAMNPVGRQSTSSSCGTWCPPLELCPPIWQLRIGDHRVFYDVDEGERRVFVRAVRRKPPHRTTGGHTVKTISVRDLQKNIKEAVDSAQDDRVVVTRRGKPAAVSPGGRGQGLGNGGLRDQLQVLGVDRRTARRANTLGRRTGTQPHYRLKVGVCQTRIIIKCPL